MTRIHPVSPNEYVHLQHNIRSSERQPQRVGRVDAENVPAHIQGHITRCKLRLDGVNVVQGG